jgi:hypothetical protein
MSHNFLIFVSVLVALISSCEKKDPVIPNEEELITTLTYTLTPISGGDPVKFSFRDIDGDGGNMPIIESGILTQNTVYNTTVVLLNESISPSNNITLEVENEGTEHQFFYTLSTSLDASVAYNDSDANGMPVGIKSILTTGSASNGQFVITLKHEPSKLASKVSDGDITNAAGETDIEISFDVEIK